MKPLSPANPCSPNHPDTTDAGGSSESGDDDGSCSQPPDEPAQSTESSELDIELVHPDEAVEASGSIDPAEVSRLVRAAADKLGVRTGRITIQLLPDEEMAALHERFAGIRAPTDVLTFDWRDPETDSGFTPGPGADSSLVTDPESDDLTVIEADIAVGLDVARREAGWRDHSTTREVILYVVHGLLHCLGYDDHDEAGFRRMHRLEDELLESLGLGRLFSSRRPGLSAREAAGRRPHDEADD